jgi:hypothetical protein
VRSETEDLAAQVTMVMPALTGARFDALLQPFVQRSVDRARAEGRHDPAPALRLDALLDALDLANQALGGGRTGSQDTSSDADPTDDAGDRTDREAPGGSPRPSRAQRRRGARTNGRTTPRRSGRTTRWGGARPKVIVRVDLTVLLRGRALPGERLDLQVAGGPPVPLTLGQLGEILDDDPMVAFVLHDGVDVYRVAHPQRRPSPLQRSALEALHDRCADIDCRAFGNLEVDHLTPWTEDGPTSLENLAPLCGATHDAKTHRGRDLHRIPGSPLVTATPLGASPDRATDPRPPATP